MYNFFGACVFRGVVVVDILSQPAPINNSIMIDLFWMFNEHRSTWPKMGA